MIANMIRAKIAAMPAMRNNPQKLSRPRLSEETGVPRSGQLACLLKYAASICFNRLLSVTLRIALETSGIRGDCNGKACRYKKS